jgi:hypothetical protein
MIKKVNLKTAEDAEIERRYKWQVKNLATISSLRFKK